MAESRGLIGADGRCRWVGVRRDWPCWLLVGYSGGPSWALETT